MTEQLLASGVYQGPQEVSIVLPCLNEAAHIEACVLSLLRGDYPTELIEILVLDGMSSDGTREILERLMESWPQIRIIDNPGASKPKGLNLGIKEARYDIVMRIDGHAVYPANYISDLVRFKYLYEADNVGGVRKNRTKGSGTIARSLAAVLTHPFGVGDAKHYTGTNSPVESNIIFLFCVRKSLFDEVGYFDERLTRGQDREFNLRLKRRGKKMVLCPSVTCTYYVRAQLIPFAVWAYEGGKTPFEISRLVGTNLLSIRNLIPPTFVTVLAGLLILGFWKPLFWLLLIGLLVVYCIIGTFVAFGKPICGNSLATKLLMPASFFLWHFSYGVGAVIGIINLALKRDRGGVPLL